MKMLINMKINQGFLLTLYVLYVMRCAMWKIRVSVEAFPNSHETLLMGSTHSLSSRFTSGPFHFQSVFPRKMWFPGLKRGGGWGKEGERENDLWSKHAQTLEFRGWAAGAKTVETEARPGQPEHEHAACVCRWLVLLSFPSSIHNHV